MRLEHFPRLEITLRQWVKVYRRTSRMAQAGLMPWLKEIKPDFLGIGAPRAASTWLHNRLARHPRIFMPHEKEVHYFDLLHRSGDRYRFSLDASLHRRWYSLCFKPGIDLVKGEVTPAYSILPVNRIREIGDYLPDVKIIYILRNPVDRAWSGMRRRTWYGSGAKAGNIDVEDLLLLAKDAYVLKRGDYCSNIKAWESVIPAERIHYIIYDDIKNNEEVELKRVCEFLDVDTLLLPEAPFTKKPINFSPESKMPEVVRHQLIQYYKKDRAHLEKKFNRDFGCWYAD